MTQEKRSKIKPTDREATGQPAKKPSQRTASLRSFAPYTVELVTVPPSKPPLKHYISVHRNGELYAVELHKEHPSTQTSHIGFYGVHWTIIKAKSDNAKTQYTIGLNSGRITRYTALTRMARKLEKDIAVYEMQRERIEKAAAHEKKDRNDHYVSQVLLRRFTDKGRLQKYTLKYGKWSSSAPKSVFSEIGYNQLLAFGKFNAELDERLKELEDTLPTTLATLDQAAYAKETTLDPTIYHRMCMYCAFLWEMSPFCKSVAPVNFIHQLMFDLSRGNVDFLDALGMTDESIAQIKRLHANGAKFIITGSNYLQLIYRLQFARQLESLYMGFRSIAKWTVARSPIELPIADMALVKYHLQDLNIVRSILPISPAMLLLGDVPLGKNLRTSNDTIVYGGELTRSGAEGIREVICQSAILTVASKTRIGDINAWRKKPVVNFVQLHNMDATLKAGQMPIISEQDFLITPVNTETYVKWVHSFLKPYSQPST